MRRFTHRGRLFAKGLSLTLALILCATSLGASAKETKADEGAPPVLSASSAILVEQSTGKILFEQNADTPAAPASITKVMTLLLAMEALDEGKISLDDQVTASAHACDMGGTQIWLEPGEKMALPDILKAVVVGSANDAAVALAEHVSGSEEEFVAAMNEKAQALGMANTVFKNACGLDTEGHVSTARDIAVMSAELLKHEKIREYSTIWMEDLRGGKTQLVNTNRLVRFYKGATGLKTGTTDNAGYCISASAERGDLSLVTVVLGAKTDDDRFEDAKALLDYGFANFTFVPVPQVQEQLHDIPVLHGVQPSVSVYADPPAGVLVKKGQESLLKADVELVENVQAPVVPDQTLGRVTVTLEGEAVCTFPLLASAEVEKMTFLRSLVFFLRSMITV